VVVVVFSTVLRSVCPPTLNVSPGGVVSAAASASADHRRCSSTQATKVGSTGRRSRVRWSIRALRCKRSFLCETSEALTGQRTACSPH
jgi:hypothetical protein